MVWEESIVLAPHSARFAFLSATIPNAREFAEWIAQTHGCAARLLSFPAEPNVYDHSCDYLYSSIILLNGNSSPFFLAPPFSSYANSSSVFPPPCPPPLGVHVPVKMPLHLPAVGTKVKISAFGTQVKMQSTLLHVLWTCYVVTCRWTR